MAESQKYQTSNLVLAGLIALTIFISLAGVAMVQTIEQPSPGVPIGSAQVKLTVAQSPAMPTAHVSLYVLPKLR